MFEGVDLSKVSDSLNSLLKEIRGKTRSGKATQSWKFEEENGLLFKYDFYLFVLSEESRLSILVFQILDFFVSSEYPF